jgi:hypothetical protein
MVRLTAPIRALHAIRLPHGGRLIPVAIGEQA